MLVEQLAQNSSNVIFDDQVLLIYTFKQLATQTVHGLALLVHHVVVLKQVFAGFEVLGFNRLLRFLNSAADEL